MYSFISFLFNVLIDFIHKNYKWATLRVRNVKLEDILILYNVNTYIIDKIN